MPIENFQNLVALISVKIALQTLTKDLTPLHVFLFSNNKSNKHIEQFTTERSSINQKIIMIKIKARHILRHNFVRFPLFTFRYERVIHE